MTVEEGSQSAQKAGFRRRQSSWPLPASGNRLKNCAKVGYQCRPNLSCPHLSAFVTSATEEVHPEARLPHPYGLRDIFMEPRINYTTAAPGALNAMLALSKSVHDSGLDEELLNLVFLRASQINGCAYCIDMHWKDLKATGVNEQKLYMLNGWHEWSGYSERERAALEWTEAVTLLTKDRVPDDVYQRARKQFNESELAWLTLAVVTINGWNRLNVAFRVPGGSYQPPSKTRKAGG